MAVVIEWQDGTIDEGPTAAAVLDVIASSPWNDCTPEEMLAKLSDRTWALRGEAIDPLLGLDEFFHGLEQAGVIEILEWSPELDPATSTRRGTSRRRSRGASLELGFS